MRESVQEPDYEDDDEEEENDDYGYDVVSLDHY